MRPTHGVLKGDTLRGDEIGARGRERAVRAESSQSAEIGVGATKNSHREVVGQIFSRELEHIARRDFHREDVRMSVQIAHRQRPLPLHQERGRERTHCSL